PHEQILMPPDEENDGNTGEAEGRAHGSDKKHGPASQLVDHEHGEHSEKKIGGADGDGLQVAGNLAESRVLEDSVQIVQDGVDSGELVEHSNGNRQEDGNAVFRGEERIARDVLGVDGLYDFLELLFEILFSRLAKHSSGFVDSPLLDQPAWTFRNSQKHQEKEHRGRGRNTELPPPLRSTQCVGHSHLLECLPPSNQSPCPPARWQL